MPFQEELTVKGKMQDLPVIIEFVEGACETAGIPPDRQFDIVLAVEEAASNVIEHAYKGRGGRLTVTFAAHGHDLHITLHDQGRPFDPAAVERPDMSTPLEDRPVGGLGMHLMHQLMDEIRYTFAPQGNTLLMIKRDVLTNHAARSGPVSGVLDG
jgi:anti-sigma regulatory factor (Ser/Thr protein kinase)